MKWNIERIGQKRGREVEYADEQTKEGGSEKTGEGGEEEFGCCERERL